MQTFPGRKMTKAEMAAIIEAELHGKDGSFPVDHFKVQRRVKTRNYATLEDELRMAMRARASRQPQDAPTVDLPFAGFRGMDR